MPPPAPKGSLAAKGLPCSGDDGDAPACAAPDHAHHHHHHGEHHAAAGGHEGAAAGSQWLQAAGRPRADDLAGTWARAEALYHHVVDGDALAGCAGGGGGGGTPSLHDEAAHVADGIAALLHCAQLLRSEAAFSSNEALEEIATPLLRYLLLEYYLAGLRQRWAGSPAARLAQLLSARAGLEAFVRDCLRRGVVPKADVAAHGFSGYAEDADGGGDGAVCATAGARRARAGDHLDGLGLSDDAAADSAGGSSVASARAAQMRAHIGADAPSRSAGRAGGHSDPAAQRAAKIERFRRTQAARRRLRELAALQQQLQRLEGGGSGGDDAGDGVGSAASLCGVDDEARREGALLALQCAARCALDELASLDAEVEILRHMVAVAGRGSSGGGGTTTAGRGAGAAAGAAAADDERLPPAERARAYAAAGPPPGDPSIDPARKGLHVVHIRPAHPGSDSASLLRYESEVGGGGAGGAEGVAGLLGPTFHTRRELVKADVFTSSARPPTLSFEEWGDIVTEKRVAREAREAVQTAARTRSLKELAESGVEGEDDPLAYEKAQAKARRFDDWADGVPRGAGVTKRV